MPDEAEESELLTAATEILAEVEHQFAEYSRSNTTAAEFDRELSLGAVRLLGVIAEVLIEIQTDLARLVARA
jgi:hypothetical protein